MTQESSTEEGNEFQDTDKELESPRSSSQTVPTQGARYRKKP